jgi:hypothetical protein
MKKCTKCGVEKPLSEFYLCTTNRKDGRQSRCKACYKTTAQARKEAIREAGDALEREAAYPGASLARTLLGPGFHSDYPEYMNVAQLARYTSTTEEIVMVGVKAGLIPHIVIGDQVRIPKAWCQPDNVVLRSEEIARRQQTEKDLLEKELAKVKQELEELKKKAQPQDDGTETVEK